MSQKTSKGNRKLEDNVRPNILNTVMNGSRLNSFVKIRRFSLKIKTKFDDTMF